MVVFQQIRFRLVFFFFKTHKSVLQFVAFAAPAERRVFDFRTCVCIFHDNEYAQNELSVSRPVGCKTISEIVVNRNSIATYRPRFIPRSKKQKQK